MAQSHSWEASGFSQEIPHILWNWKFHCPIRKISASVQRVFDKSGYLFLAGNYANAFILAFLAFLIYVNLHWGRKCQTFPFTDPVMWVNENECRRLLWFAKLLHVYWLNRILQVFLFEFELLVNVIDKNLFLGMWILVSHINPYPANAENRVSS
jgi:hypothetical protein